MRKPVGWLFVIILLFSNLILAASKDLDLDLMMVAATGELQAVKQLVAQGANVNGTDMDGSTPLMMATANSQYENAAYLISKGANINAKNHNGMTSLMQAAFSGNKELVQLLLSKGADPGAKDKEGYNAAYFALLCQHTEIADVLMAETGKLTAGTSKTQAELDEALRVVLRQNDPARVKELISKGASIKVIFPDNGDSVLHIAVEKGNLELTDLFIAKGVSPNVINHKRETPLHYAVLLENVPIVKLLLTKGAKADVQNDQWEAPLYLVTRMCRERFTATQQQMIELLLANGADINQTNHGETQNGKMTALHGAVTVENTALAKFLLDKGAKLDARSSDGWTPLHLAVIDHSVKMVRFLVGKGANVNISDESGWTPLQTAKMLGNAEIIAILSKEEAM